MSSSEDPDFPEPTWLKALPTAEPASMPPEGDPAPEPSSTPTAEAAGNDDFPASGYGDPPTPDHEEPATPTYGAAPAYTDDLAAASPEPQEGEEEQKHETSPLSPDPAPDATTEASPPRLAPIARFAESVGLQPAQMRPSIPFTLRIVGALGPDHRDKLSSLLSKEKLGFSSVDLEPQWTAGRVLLPRISEYAAILIAQCLRDAEVELEIWPSVDADAALAAPPPEPPHSRVQAADAGADGGTELPIFSSAELPAWLSPGSGQPAWVPLGAMSLSQVLSPRQAEGEQSQDFLDALGALKTALRRRARARGARAVVDFRAELTPLSLGSRYRLTASGLAVGPARAAWTDETPAAPASEEKHGGSPTTPATPGTGSPAAPAGPIDDFPGF